MRTTTVQHAAAPAPARREGQRGDGDDGGRRHDNIVGRDGGQQADGNRGPGSDDEPAPAVPVATPAADDGTDGHGDDGALERRDDGADGSGSGSGDSSGGSSGPGSGTDGHDD